MKRLEEYIIPLKGLERGEQNLTFRVEKTFIDCFDDDDISDSDVVVTVKVTKTVHTTELRFKIKGIVSVFCDRCLDDLDLKIEQKFNLFLKFGEAFNEIDDEVVIIPHEEGFFDLSSYVYEYIKLSIPIQKVHKKEKCNPDMLTLLGMEKESGTKQEIDPRWEALKKIENNN